MKQIFFSILYLVSFSTACQSTTPTLVDYDDVVCGANRLALYLPLIQNKNVAVVANQSSTVDNKHLVDTLLANNIIISKIFCPEHGFRGKADAGEIISDEIDLKTGIPIISLYGSHKKPTKEDLNDVDIVIFDLQDVGTRFYTYISTLTYVMESCAENNIPVIVLDRPNPNGYFIDGPILENEFSSFVGLHPIPVVYGMTIGEYAKLVKGEHWIAESDKLDLTVIPMDNYDHNLIVKLKNKPSPNLPNWQSVYLYPSLCFFEGTVMSIGRGTDFPFQVYGHPDLETGSFVFKPEPNEGSSKPKHNGTECYGLNLTGYASNYKTNDNQINLSWLIDAYNTVPSKEDFFISYFEKLAGTASLRQQIASGLSEEEIRSSWQPGLDKFKKIRSKYLLYP